MVAGWLLATTLWAVTASIAVAVVIAASFAPFIVRLRARGRSRTVAAAIVWAVALLILTGVALLLAFALVPYVVGARDQLAGLQRLKADLAAHNIPPEFADVAGKSPSRAPHVSGDFVSQIATPPAR